MDMSISTFKDRLKCYRKLNSIHVNFVNIDLYKLMLKENALLAGYESIKSNKGATPLLGTLSLNGFSRQRLTRLRKGLRNESWIPSPAKRIYIPKTGFAEKRPLVIQEKAFHPLLLRSIPSFLKGAEEKIVQATMLMVLEAIYEPIFLGTSFGFRPGLGTHDALKAIDQKYDGMTYAIESDIKGMYDNVNHRILIALIEKRIKDDRFIRLLWKMLKAGYLKGGKQNVKADIGTPPGSIISPILTNIYLHELDLFMMEKKLDVTIRKNKRRTPIYIERENRIQVIKLALQRKDYSFQSRQNHLKELSFLKVENFGVRMYCDPSNRIHYTRYADKFIVGIAGSLEFANHLKEAIAGFLSTLGLYLNLEKTKVTDIRKDFAFFLGHRITIDTSINYVRPKGKVDLLKKVKCFKKKDTDLLRSPFLHRFFRSQKKKRPLTPYPYSYPLLVPQRGKRSLPLLVPQRGKKSLPLLLPLTPLTPKELPLLLPLPLPLPLTPKESTLTPKESTLTPKESTLFTKKKDPFLPRRSLVKKYGQGVKRSIPLLVPQRGKKSLPFGVGVGRGVGRGVGVGVGVRGGKGGEVGVGVRKGKRDTPLRYVTPRLGRRALFFLVKKVRRVGDRYGVRSLFFSYGQGKGYGVEARKGNDVRCQMLGGRCQGRLVSIEAPINRIVQRLSAKRFCDKKGTPIAKALWITQEDNQIVQNFNVTIRSIFGFYSGVKKRRYLQRIWYILKFSCALTFAAKHRCSLNKIFLKHGQLLRIHFGASGERQVTLYQPSFKEADRKWQHIA